MRLDLLHNYINMYYSKRVPRDDPPRNFKTEGFGTRASSTLLRRATLNEGATLGRSSVVSVGWLKSLELIVQYKENGKLERCFEMDPF
jgi:hypothetical protein